MWEQNLQPCWKSMQAGFYFAKAQIIPLLERRVGGWPKTVNVVVQARYTDRSPDLNASLSGRRNGRKRNICIIWLHFSNTGDCKEFKNNDTRFYVEPFFIVEDRFQTCPGLTLWVLPSSSKWLKIRLLWKLNTNSLFELHLQFSLYIVLYSKVYLNGRHVCMFTEPWLNV